AHVPDNGLLTGSFKASLEPLGHLHPVTEGLNPNWGPRYRALHEDETHVEDLMNGPNGTPLLLHDHVDQGRVAL
ncbi:VWA domain-containing protein, partial [Neokomagataea sp. TBRC 2177]|nr:VWA domain-containing protein [Neokomagataea anthophila]